MSINRTSGTAPRSARGPNVARTQAFLRGLVSEMKRVTWPTREEWIAATVLTIGLVVGVGLFTFLVDQVFEYLFHFVHNT